MTIGQKGQDGPSSGTGHQFPRSNEPFGPVVRPTKVLNTESRERAENKGKERQDFLEYLAGFPDFVARVTERTPTDELARLVQEAKGRRDQAERNTREKADAVKLAWEQAERDWYNS